MGGGRGCLLWSTDVDVEEGDAQTQTETQAQAHAKTQTQPQTHSHRHRCGHMRRSVIVFLEEVVAAVNGLGKRA